jgi:hypothetical protein
MLLHDEDEVPRLVVGPAGRGLGRLREVAFLAISLKLLLGASGCGHETMVCSASAARKFALRAGGLSAP